MNAALAIGFFAAAVRVGTPLLLAALGETVAESSGVINLGIEGEMLAGALAAAVVAATHGNAAGAIAGVLAGVLVSLVFALVAIRARADQIITGTAITLAATGLTGLVAQRVWGNAGAGLTLSVISTIPVPVLQHIPAIGPVLFNQSIVSYITFALVPFSSWWLLRTRSGRELRACGEAPAAARAAGVSVDRMRIIATLFGGACAGLAGASLVLVEVGTFTERMTAGRGFIAIAIVALGRWRPWTVATAALLFGASIALQYVVQASGSRIPYQLFLAFPYLLALVVLVVALGRRRGPAALGSNG